MPSHMPFSEIAHSVPVKWKMSVFISAVVTAAGLLCIKPLAGLLCSQEAVSPLVMEYTGVTLAGALPRILIYIPFWYLRLDHAYPKKNCSFCRTARGSPTDRTAPMLGVYSGEHDNKSACLLLARQVKSGIPYCVLFSIMILVVTFPNPITSIIHAVCRFLPSSLRYQKGM